MANSDKARWTRLASLGLTLAGLGPALILVAGLIFGLDFEGDLVFFLGTALLGFVAAFLVLRFGMWSKVVGILAGVLLAMALFWTAFGLAQPGSFFDFIPGVLVLPGALMAIAASIAAIIATRRGRVSARPEGGERTGIRIALGVVAVAVIGSGALTLMSRTTADARGTQATALLEDFKFDKGEYQVSGGTTIFVSNEDPFFHTFTIDELEIDEGFGAGSSKRIEIPGRPGTYVVYCRPHTANPDNPEEDDMAARITVL